MECNLEDNPIENVEGKKRHHSDKSVSNVPSNQDLLESTDGHDIAHTQ